MTNFYEDVLSPTWKEEEEKAEYDEAVAHYLVSEPEWLPFKRLGQAIVDSFYIDPFLS